RCRSYRARLRASARFRQSGHRRGAAGSAACRPSIRSAARSRVTRAGAARRARCACARAARRSARDRRPACDKWRRRFAGRGIRADQGLGPHGDQSGPCPPAVAAFIFILPRRTGYAAVVRCEYMLRTAVVTALAAAFVCVPLPAQRPFSGATEIEQSLQKLNELGTVLHIAAHPDDERTALLAYFARGRHMRTAYLSLTRGEGGQNLIGSEQGAQMGIIRTQELLDARQIDGAEQFFTRAIDFGFTRTADETMQKWGHDRILSDVVWIVRRYRPDVIINGFSGTSRDGHGQHQTSAILGKEAFTAAADPTKFPEQLKYVKPWQTKRLIQAVGFGGFGFANVAPGQTPAGGGRGGPQPAANTEPAGPYAETGAFNPLLGYSYDELAVLSRSMHHSQGTGAMRRIGGGRSGLLVIGGPPAT